MPTSKFLRTFSSKDSSKDSPGASPDASPDTTPKIQVKDILTTETLTIADPDVPQYSDAMEEAWSAGNVEPPQTHGAERFLNDVGMLVVSVPRGFYADVNKGKIQDAVMLSVGQQAAVDTLAAPALDLLNTPQIADTIEKGLSTFMEAVPVLMKALDEVAKVHPFISGMDGSTLDTRALTDGY